MQIATSVSELAASIFSAEEMTKGEDTIHISIDNV
jgi:hypothetical protein